MKDIHDANNTPEIFKVREVKSSYSQADLATMQATLEISTITSSSAGILVADIYGSIHLLDKDFESISSWVAHVGGRVTHMVEKKGILVTLGVRIPLHGLPALISTIG